LNHNYTARLSGTHYLHEPFLSHGEDGAGRGYCPAEVYGLLPFEHSRISSNHHRAQILDAIAHPLWKTANRAWYVTPLDTTHLDAIEGVADLAPMTLTIAFHLACIQPEGALTGHPPSRRAPGAAHQLPPPITGSIGTLLAVRAGQECHIGSRTTPELPNPCHARSIDQFVL